MGSLVLHGLGGSRAGLLGASGYPRREIPREALRGQSLTSATIESVGKVGLGFRVQRVLLRLDVCDGPPLHLLRNAIVPLLSTSPMAIFRETQVLRAEIEVLWGGVGPGPLHPETYI